MSGVSGILIAVLLMSAALGCLIGVAACAIVTRHRAPARDRVLERDADQSLCVGEFRLAQSHEELPSDHERFASELAISRAAERETLSRHEALEVHAHVQARQIDTLMEEQRAAEERQIRLERALRSQQQESGLVARERGVTGDNIRPQATPASSLVDRSDDVPIGEASVPVLNRRAAPVGAVVSSLRRSRLSSGRLARGSGGRAGSVIALNAPIEEGDFPALSEADLPDDVDGLELDVVDVDGRR